MRCTPISDGCKNCWHLAMAKRMAGNPKICPEFRNAYGGAIPPVLIHNEIDAPLRLRKPARIGVQFMGDLFHEDVPDEFIESIFRMMAIARHHLFLVLTKRANRMKEWFTWGHRRGMYEHPYNVSKNIWLGVTVCNQPEADEKIPLLLQIPAAVYFISIEPMLGPINLNVALARGIGEIHWVVLGTESGPGRRPAKLEDMINVVSQCKSAGIPVFVKQVEIKGKTSKSQQEWPKELHLRELPSV